MKIVPRLALLLVLSSPTLAAEFELIGRAAWVQSTGEADIPSLEFESAPGFGVATNIFWSDRFSTEFGVQMVNPDIEFRLAEDVFAILKWETGVNVVPVTAVAQYHFGPRDRWDFFVGGGVAYVLFEDVDDPGELDELNLSAINFEDDFAFVLNGGFNWRFGERWALNSDVKYAPGDSEAEIVSDRGETLSGNIAFSPVIIAVGIAYRF